jgi:hypothetical protein
MTNNETSSSDSSAVASNAHGHIEPCACCRALAHVRMPWMDGSNTRSDEFSAAEQYNGSEDTHTKTEAKASKNSTTFRIPKFSFDRKKSPAAESTQPGEATEPSAITEERKDRTEEKETDWHDDLNVPKTRGVWKGWDGLAVMSLGVVIPMLMLFGSCISAPKRWTLVLLNHPIETVAEVVFILAIPAAIYFAWSSLCKNNATYSLPRGVALGSAIGTSIVIAATSIAAMFAGSQMLQAEIGTNFSTGFCFIAFLALAAGAVAACLVNRFRLSRDFEGSRRQVIAFTAVGALLAPLTLVAAEARPWMVRLTEQKAVSTNAHDQIDALHQLRLLNPERELRMECSDPRAAGLCGLFIAIKKTNLRTLYFELKGQPYSFRDGSSEDLASMPDEYLTKHVVGEKLPGLSLARSFVAGSVHPQTLTSSVSWTFVFKNSSESSQEARAEIGLPPGAAITGLTLWTKGEPREASFSASGKAEGIKGNWKQIGHDGPAMITDLGHQRVLLHCSPVQPDEELKVSATMVIPLKPEGSASATMSLPKLLASNFELKGDYSLKLTAPENMTSTAKHLTASNSESGRRLAGMLSDDELQSNLIVDVARPKSSQSVAVLDRVATQIRREEEWRIELKRLEVERAKHNAEISAQNDKQIIVMIDGSKGVQNQLQQVTQALGHKGAKQSKALTPKIKAIKPTYLLENISRTTAPAPKHLVVVLDGSETMGEHINEVTAALAKLPIKISTEVIVASQEPGCNNILPLKEAISKLSTFKYVGGQDNLQSVVKAAELAGETKGGAVLWMHGPQPMLNEEIYITSPFASPPLFYELPVGSGDTDTFDFFRNHSEIGPFAQVPRYSENITADLSTFFSKWKPDSDGFAVKFFQGNARPEDSIHVSDLEAQELLALHAYQQCNDLLATRHIRKAVRLALGYGLVTPVSCALVSRDETPVDEDETSPPIGGMEQPSKTEAPASTPATDNELTSSAEPGSQNAPELQGSTNATIGQYGSATCVSGINTAGTVRVNNLANLEALLNIIANLSEMGCGLVGVILIVNGFVSKLVAIDFMGHTIELSGKERIGIGIALIVIGLAVPGTINWFVASARDANLFN